MNKNVYIEDGSELKELIIKWNGRSYGALTNFADLHKIDRTTLHKKLRGERPIKPKEVKEWSQCLGIKEEQRKAVFKGEVK